MSYTSLSLLIGYAIMINMSAICWWFCNCLHLSCHCLICEVVSGEGYYDISLFCMCKFMVFDRLRQCRYVGNIHTQVTEPLLQEVFASTGPVEACKLIRKEKVLIRNTPTLFPTN